MFIPRQLQTTRHRHDTDETPKSKSCWVRRDTDATLTTHHLKARSGTCQGLGFIPEVFPSRAIAGAMLLQNTCRPEAWTSIRPCGAPADAVRPPRCIRVPNIDASSSPAQHKTAQTRLNLSERRWGWGVGGSGRSAARKNGKMVNGRIKNGKRMTRK